MPAFLLLGVIWAAVLLPPWLQARREARPTASMLTFRRQLWSLARTSPVHSPMYTDAFAAHGAYTDGFGTYDDDPDDLDDLGELDELAHRRSSAASFGGDAAPHPEPGAGPRRTSGAYRRRRRILAALTLLAAATVGPAVLLGGPWWIGQGVAGGLLLTYLALLVRRHRRLVERAQKVRYLAPIRAPRPAVVVLGSGAAH